MQWEPAIVARRRTHSTLQTTTSVSLQILRLHAIAVENMLAPRLGNVGAIGAGNNKRPLLDQHDGSCRMRGRAVQTRDVAGSIWQQGVVLIEREVFRILAVAFLEVALGQAELLHSREGPGCSGSVFINNGGFDISVRCFGYRGEHIPGLKQSGPQKIGPHPVLAKCDERAVDGETPAGNRQNMKDQESVEGDVFRLGQRICPPIDLLWSIAHGIRTGILPKLLRENEMVPRICMLVPREGMCGSWGRGRKCKRAPRAILDTLVSAP